MRGVSADGRPGMGSRAAPLPRTWTARAYRPRSRRSGRPRAAPHRSPILGIVDWRQAATRPPPRRRAAGIARVVASYRSLVRLLPAGGQEPCEASAVTASAVNRPHRMGNVGTRPAGGRSGRHDVYAANSTISSLLTRIDQLPSTELPALNLAARIDQPYQLPQPQRSAPGRPYGRTAHPAWLAMIDRLLPVSATFTSLG